MKLLDYIRGPRKGKDAHRLEKESMQDSFLADALDGYQQVEGEHEKQIKKLRKHISARTGKRRNTYAISWSIAACLVIGIGISSYFLFIKKNLVDVEEILIAAENASPQSSVPASPQKDTSLFALKTQKDSTPTIAVKSPKKEIIAKARQTNQLQDIELQTVHEDEIAINSVSSKIQEESTEVSAYSVDKEKIMGKVTDRKGEPIIGASVSYKGTNIGTVTDIDGEFSLPKQPGNKELIAHSIGYEPIDIAVDTSRAMLIAMNEDKQELDAVIVTGYATKRKSFFSKKPKTVLEEEKAISRTPKPIIGKRKYESYLKKNLIHPTDDECKDIKGKVTLSFFVNKEGSPQDITVVKGLCPSADREAIRLLREGPKWTVGKLPATLKIEF